MSKTALAPIISTRAGIAGAYTGADASNGNVIKPFTGFETVFILNSDSGNTHTATFYAQSSDDRGNKTNIVLTIPESTTSTTPVIAGPFNYADWYDPATGGMDVTGSHADISFMVVTNPVYNAPSQTGG